MNKHRKNVESIFTEGPLHSLPSTITQRRSRLELTEVQVIIVSRAHGRGKSSVYAEISKLNLESFTCAHSFTVTPEDETHRGSKQGNTREQCITPA